MKQVRKTFFVHCSQKSSVLCGGLEKAKNLKKNSPMDCLAAFQASHPTPFSRYADSRNVPYYLLYEDRCGYTRKSGCLTHMAMPSTRSLSFYPRCLMGRGRMSQRLLDWCSRLFRLRSGIINQWSHRVCRIQRALLKPRTGLDTANERAGF